MAEIHLPNQTITSVTFRETILLYEALKNYRISLKRLSDLNKSDEVSTLIEKVKGKKWIIYEKERHRKGVSARPR